MRNPRFTDEGPKKKLTREQHCTKAAGYEQPSAVMHGSQRADPSMVEARVVGVESPVPAARLDAVGKETEAC